MIFTPRQADADALLLKTWAARVARHKKTIRAERAMQRWHKDPRSEGKLDPPAPPACVVLALSVRRRRG